MESESLVFTGLEIPRDYDNVREENVLAEERQNDIVSQVNEKGSVLVKELSEKYGVTEDSIRKDLTLLEKKES